eukprot:scaffold2519_cov168-Amphora_coffeaeformis.AAC.28
MKCLFAMVVQIAPSQPGLGNDPNALYANSVDSGLTMVQRAVYHTRGSRTALAARWWRSSRWWSFSRRRQAEEETKTGE